MPPRRSWLLQLAGMLWLVAATAPAQTPAEPGLITGVGNFSHIVASLDRSIQFYRDVIGLELENAPRVFSGTEAMKVGNTPGAQSLFATLKVPGSEMGVEVIEYKDIDRRPAQARFQDPGAANLVLTVRDLDAIVARIKKASARINSAGGVPATLPGGQPRDFRAGPRRLLRGARSVRSDSRNDGSCVEQHHWRRFRNHGSGYRPYDAAL